MKFETEKQSIEYVCDCLASSGYTNIHYTQIDDEFCHYDIWCNAREKKYFLECKRRNFQSDKYGDAIIEETKYNDYITAKNNKEIDGAWVVTLFDDCWTVSNAFTPFKTTEKFVQHTTEFADHTKVLKRFKHYNLDYKFSY